MLTREEILDTYSVDATGYITSGVTFRGERIYVPYFWDKLKGRRRVTREQSPDGVEWMVLTVTKDDREAFPELSCIASIGLRKAGRSVLSWIRGLTY